MYLVQSMIRNDVVNPMGDENCAKVEHSLRNELWRDIVRGAGINILLNIKHMVEEELE